MNEGPWVLDASALLAAMRGEPGAEAVRDRLAVARISAVNLSEVVAKLQDYAVPDTAIEDSLAELSLEVVAFDGDQAIGAGKLRRATRGAGLSFGDRACLNLARGLDGVALTTDRAWVSLSVDARVELIR